MSTVARRMTDMHRQIRKIRIVLVFLLVALVLIGLTAFPIETGLRWIASVLPDSEHSTPSAVTAWILTVRDAVIDTNARYPFLAYGTDWLAFAHLVIAVAFIGPLKDPVRNNWVIDFGLIACAGVIPVAMIAGHIRGIPLWWRLIDCSFGVFGAVPLLVVRRWIRGLPTSE